MARSGLQPFTFWSINKRGARIKHTFYAKSQRQATAFALDWSERTSTKLYRARSKRGS